MLHITYFWYLITYIDMVITHQLFTLIKSTQIEVELSIVYTLVIFDFDK